ncbi:type 2 periplasmic-binding domain-containing protein [Hypericibacter terrae]|uniref:hypothetical protein n=1 Tax=Hypericibacter terrae TaxID=2602015 RepID=UPI001247EECF|nr:hypothetical protein [Hypericibacter terrae]
MFSASIDLAWFGFSAPAMALGLPAHARRPVGGRHVDGGRMRGTWERAHPHSSRDAGSSILRPIAGEFLKAHAVARIPRLLDRGISLVDEGMDLVRRPSPLADSSVIIRRAELQDCVAVLPLPEERT